MRLRRSVLIMLPLTTILLGVASPTIASLLQDGSDSYYLVFGSHEWRLPFCQAMLGDETTVRGVCSLLGLSLLGAGGLAAIIARFEHPAILGSAGVLLICSLIVAGAAAAFIFV